MRRITAAILATAAVGIAGFAGGCATPVIVAPTWAETPSPEDMGDAYPRFATAIDMEGRAELQCFVTPTGTLSECEVLRASPSGLGFDRAALELTPRFRASPRTIDGVRHRSRVRFTVQFRLAEPDDRPAPWAGPEPSAEALALARRIVRRAPSPPPPPAADIDVDPDRREWLVSTIRRIDADLEPGMREAAALAMARYLSPEMLRMVSMGQRRPPPPTDPERFASAGDRMIALRDRRSALLRQAWCDRYGCGEVAAAD